MACLSLYQYKVTYTAGVLVGQAGAEHVAGDAPGGVAAIALPTVPVVPHANVHLVNKGGHAFPWCPGSRSV